jgi:hypothetical protein
MNLGNEFRPLTELAFSYTEVHTFLVLTISAFRNLGRVILILTELPLPNTGVPLGSIMTLSADLNLSVRKFEVGHPLCKVKAHTLK